MTSSNSQISAEIPLCQAPEVEPSASYPKRLAAFDFDQTIINDNTDTVARALLKPSLISQDVQKLAETEGWTKYMQEIFRLLHENGTKPPAIKKAIIEINEVPGMVKCLKTIHKMNFDLIVISDSNSEFIRQWNMTHGLANTFCEIFTNPGWFEDNGLLKIEPYHHQTECKLSATNLCKGKLLDAFIRKKQEDGVKYEQVFYIGDGTNDICPLLRLTAKDYGCPRKDFSMDKRLVKSNICIRANLLRWSTGFELLGQILNAVKQ